MAQLSSLIPLVRERCGGVLEQSMRDQLKRAYQTFCSESHFLARTQQFSQGEEPALAVDDEHIFANVDFVLDEHGNEMERGIDYNVSPAGEVWLIKNTTAFRVFYHISPQLLVSDSFEANDTVVNRWADALADGAAAKLCMMPNTKWTDFGLSEYYMRRFTDGYREAYRVAINTLDEHRPTKPRDFF